MALLSASSRLATRRALASRNSSTPALHTAVRTIVGLQLEHPLAVPKKGGSFEDALSLHNKENAYFSKRRLNSIFNWEFGDYHGRGYHMNADLNENFELPPKFRGNWGEEKPYDDEVMDMNRILRGIALFLVISEAFYYQHYRAPKMERAPFGMWAENCSLRGENNEAINVWQGVLNWHAVAIREKYYRAPIRREMDQHNIWTMKSYYAEDIGNANV